MCRSFPPIWNPKCIWEIQQRIQRCASMGLPNIQLLPGEKWPACPEEPLVVFASSFNPPTMAHELMVHQALERHNQGHSLLLLDLLHADKPPQDALIEDRALMMQIAFARVERRILGVSSHGRFIDKMAALNELGFAAKPLIFLVGMDTFERILNPRFYADPQRELGTLFARAKYIVFSRTGVSSTASAGLDSWMSRGAQIELAELPESFGCVSSTMIRESRAAGSLQTGWIKEGIRGFIEATGLYLPSPPHPPLYERRKKQLKRLSCEGPQAFVNLDMRETVLSSAHSRDAE